MNTADATAIARITMVSIATVSIAVTTEPKILLFMRTAMRRQTPYERYHAAKNVMIRNGMRRCAIVITDRTEPMAGNAWAAITTVAVCSKGLTFLSFALLRP